MAKVAFPYGSWLQASTYGDKFQDGCNWERLESNRKISQPFLGIASTLAEAAATGKGEVMSEKSVQGSEKLSRFSWLMLW